MSTSLSQDEIARRAGELRWYHSIELPGGYVTKGVVRNAQVLPRLSLPARLDGKTVLDIGAWDGFYSFDAAERGARRVLATDSFVWSGRTWGSKATFDFAREALGLTEVVDDQLVDPMELSPETLGGTFDVVLFLGVLYHLADPIGALERAASVCDELLVLETETALNWLPYPAARVHPGAGLNDDPTNWFQFSVDALEGLLRQVGFSSVEVVFRYPLWRRVARAARDRLTGNSFREGLKSSRVVLHARK